jgi:hypothetical protein
MVNCHEARADVLKAQQLAGTVGREYRLRLQQVIIGYYYNLRPLRDHSAVDGWWDEVVLSREWVKDENVEKSVEGSPENGLEIVEERVEEYYRGLGTIETIPQMKEEWVEVESGMMGKKETKRVDQKVLDAQVLLDIASTLDDAADKLGFSAVDEQPVKDTSVYGE